MAKKVTLRKKCGDKDCENPNCEFEIIEKNESVWQLIKQSFKNLFPVDGFTAFGSIIFIGWYVLLGIAIFSGLLEWIGKLPAG